MNPFIGSFIKMCEVGVLFPLHRIENHQHVYNMKLKPTLKALTSKGKLHIYKGMQYQIAHSAINRFADVNIYNAYGQSEKSASLSFLCKSLTFPL